MRLKTMIQTNPGFRELLKSGRIGQMELRNRIVMAATGTYFAGRDGLVTERLKGYYAERARGGAGLIVVEVASVDYPRGRVMTRQIGISDDKFIPGLAELAEVVHQHGAKLGIQIQHGGRIAAPFLSGGHEPVSASAVPLVPAELGAARELTVLEIRQLVQCFAAAAGRAKKAGIDGVEIHAGHGYLIDQFLSRSTNSRQDEYGGTLENRARFLLEIIGAVRGVVGREYPAWCRIDGREFGIENGITQDEAQNLARMIENAGVDAVHVSGYGGSAGVGFTEAPLVNIPGYLVPLARGIKQKVNIPVITAGRISPKFGEKVIRQGDADFIAMGRSLVADPELPNKLLAGNEKDIRKCIYCYTCVHQIFVRNGVCCAVNASAGKESEPAPAPPVKSKKVIIVGGGPAGMEAARVAALRGHQVTLYEKERRLGGTLLLASIVRKENEELTAYLIRQLKKLNVRIESGKKVTPEIVTQLRPDVLILATGATRRNPPIQGIDKPNVIDGDKFRALIKPFRKPSLIRKMSGLWMPLGRKIAIIGGGMVGCELAAFLAERGRKVTVLESGEQIGMEMPIPFRWMIMDKLNQNSVPVITGVTYDEITDKGVAVTLKAGNNQIIEANNIIIADGIEPDKEQVAAFQSTAPEVYCAGDCGKLSYIKDSIAEGARVASTI